MARAISIQAYAMTAQPNRRFFLENQYASTMSSHLRDFTRMNLPMFLGSNIDQDSQDSFDEVYKILFDTG